MSNIFDKLAEQNKDSTNSEIFDRLAKTQGGEQNAQNQSQTNSDRNAGRESNQQIQSSDEGGIQANGEPSSLYNSKERQAPRKVADIFDKLSKQNRSETNEGLQENEAYGTQAQKEGQGIRGQVPTRNQKEVNKVGVQPPDQGFFEKAKGATIAAGASGAETYVGLKAGEFAAKQAGKFIAKSLAGRVLGTVAAAAAIPVDVAEASTGIGALAIPATEMAAFAAGSYLGDKATELVERIIGVDDTIEKAKEENPMIAQAASLATMAPMAYGSIKNLASMTAKERATKLGGGAIGGAAFEPIRYGVESILKGVTGSDKEVSPITLGSEAQSIAMGAVLSAHGVKEIAKTVGPETAREALNTPTEKYAELATPEKVVEPTEASKPEGNRIGSAAWKNSRTGAVYYGKDHEEALANAKRDAQDPSNKDKVAVGDLPVSDTTKPENRETDDFGFITTNGEFVSRAEAEDIAKQSGQLKKEKERDLLHSHEVQLDFHEESQKTSEVPRQLPGAASKGQFTESRMTEAVKAMDDAESGKGRPLDVNNEGDKRAWLSELNKRFDLGTFTLDEQNSLWNQSHEAYRIRNAAGKTIPPEEAVKQIGGKRIQSQRILAAKNEAINKQREARGDAPLLPGREITQLAAWQEAAKNIAEDPQYLYNLTAELKAGKRTATAEESLALLQHSGEIQNRIDDLSEQRNSETDQTKINKIDSLIESEYNDLRDAEQVYRNVGTEVSAALRIRRIQAAADFSLPRVIAQKEKTKGRKLTKVELEEVKADVDQVKKLTDQANGLNKKRIEQRQDSDIESETKQPKKKSNLTADEQIEKHTLRIESNKENPQKLSSSMKDLARAIAQKRLEFAEEKIGRKLTPDEEKQVTKPRDLSQATHDIASKVLGESWTLKDTRDAISGYGLYTNADKTALSLAISRLTGENRNIGKIESIIKDQEILKTGKQRNKPDAGERALVKRVNALARKFGIKAQDPESQLAGALESTKTRARNLIEELEEIFLKGRPLNEESKAQIAKEDPELANLKGEILGLRQLIEDTYGKREIPMEQKVKTLEGIYENLIKRYEKEISSGEVYKTTSKGEPITSEKLEQQRETLKNLRAERQHIRDADSLRQEALKVAKAEKRISEISKILSGDVVDPKTGKNLAEGPESKLVTNLRSEVANLEASLKQYRDSLKVKKTEDEKLLDTLNKKKENAEERLARIQTGESKERTEQKVARTTEQKEVQKEIDSLNSQIKEYQEANRKRKTDSEKREALLERQIKNQKEILSKQEIKQKEAKVKPTSPRIQELEKELASLKDQTMSEDWYVARKEALALQGYKNRINNQIEDAKQRLATGDYSKVERKEMKIDEEARQKRLELAELKDRIRQNQTLEEWKNRPPLKKAADAVIKFKRAAVLSYLSTWSKLTAASLEIPLLRVPTAVAGKVLERTPFFREIAAKARQEYGSPLSQDVKAYAEGIWDGVKEFKKIAFKLGRSELDLEYGGTSLIPLGALDMPGKLHEAIKYPTKLANYKMAFARYLQHAIRENPNIDINDPVLREKAGIEAYKEANASIFLQDNGFVNKYNLLVNKMKESDSWRQRLAARFLEFNIPIVRIPANIVKEALEYQFGFFTGTSKAIRMKMSKEVGKRLEDISPEDADSIMRQIKKGSVGLMAIAIGYALPDYFGGFYRKGAEKDEESPEYGGIGVIPKTLLHHPAFVPFQIGATMRKLMDETIMDRETLGDDAEAIARGYAEGQLGLIEELPFINISRNVGKYIDPTRLSETGGEFAKSMIPGFIQEAAKVMDVPEQDVGGALKTLFWNKKDVTKRKAETFLDHIYEGLPVLRQQVDEK